MKSILFTSNWEKYFVTVDEALSQIKLDLGASDFREAYDHSFFIRLDYDFEGDFPNETEEKEMTQILEYIEAALLASKEDAKFVGSVSSKKQIDFIFVAKKVFNLKDILKRVLKDYSYQSSWLKDDRWNIYDKLLYPSEIDLIYIYNRKLLQSYHASHDAMDSDLYQYQVFHEQKDAQAFLGEVYEDFEVLDTILTQDKMYIVQLKRKESMTFIDLNQVALELHALAKKHHGHYVSCHYLDVHKEQGHESRS